MSVMNGNCDYEEQENQRIALREFRKAVQDVLQPHHDDHYLLRWLRARDFDLAKSERMLRESLKFRRKVGADLILTSAYELPEVFQQHNITANLGFDNEHSTVRLIMCGLCDYKGLVASLKVLDLMKILIYVLENDLKMMQERKKKLGTKIEEKTTFILDFQNFNLKQFYDRAVINAGIQLITMYQDNYPETLKAAYLVNVPSYFTWIFNIFKPFLNAVTLSKIKICRTDEWKEEICEIMDPNIIPAFLGGNFTDPDGDPKCSNMINWDSKIPSSFYMKETKLVLEDDPSLKSTTVQQRATFEVPVTVEKEGSVLKWLFQTKDNNIRFGVFYKNGKKTSEVLFPIQNVECHVIPETGEIICDKIGEYILHFDNSYSWLTAKQLLYKVEVDDPTIIENNNN